MIMEKEAMPEGTLEAKEDSKNDIVDAIHNDDLGRRGFPEEGGRVDNERIVYIKRKQTFIEEANSDPAVQEYFDMSYKAIGSYYKQTGKQFGTGLTRKEELILLPEVTGVYFDTDKRDYRRAVDSFYRNINTKVPPTGLRLNIALENESKPLSDENLPVSIRDYLIWKHALGHPETGKNLQEAEMFQHMRFYIEDSEVTTKEASNLSNKEDQARLAYYKINEDEDKVTHVLTLLGVTTKSLSFQEKLLKVKDAITIEDAQSNKFNEQKLSKFLAIVNDKRLAVKHEIEQMIAVDVLQRVGTKVLIRESGEEIGTDLLATALWFEDKGNSKEVNVLRARYKEFSKS